MSNPNAGAAAQERHCEVCGGPLGRRNVSGICNRTPECNRVRSERIHRARAAVPTRDTVRERLFANLIIHPSGCLLWAGKRDRAGYGQIRAKGRHRPVHVVMWELYEDPVPSGMELDHVKAFGCANRHCASIAHLQPVTHRENVLRGASASAANAIKTHCDAGHEFTPENTYVNSSRPGTRCCRKCNAAAAARYKARKDAA